MSISDKSRKAMESLGLTSYEIKVYLSLLEAGSMTASNISKKSGVPYSKIYEVLNSLEDKGWLESDSSRPQKFFPKSPLTAVEAMKMRIESSIRDSKNMIMSELMPIYRKSGLRERPEIWVVMGVYNIAAKISEIIQTFTTGSRGYCKAITANSKNVTGKRRKDRCTCFRRGKFRYIASHF
jgi:sugar-specific transcriptional regulator TrmB